jgi:aminomethyltransferase
VLERACGALPALAPDAWIEGSLAGRTLRIARFGWSGEDAYQLFAPCDGAAAVREHLLASLPESARRLVSQEALEVLRIEAGRPRLAAELSEDVLPPEARLENAISYTKGCYIGQEIVARLRSRGHVNHLLVGLRFAGGELPERGARVCAGEREVGEITSIARSPHAGAIALGFVRAGFEAPGTLLDVVGLPAKVAALPLVAPAEAAP